ncbi:MAG: ABC transporter permease [Alphaproteobacteria bacterium]|jgi:tungstate transport system permease protein|nr:ABC transporter permease [Alphaproteobacteria bacterium]
MTDFWSALLAAFELLSRGDSYLQDIVILSLHVSMTAVGLATVVGLPIGAMMALFRFPGRRVLIVCLNALMGLPPVVVGLIVYLALSRAGPFGVFGLLFTPTAMIIAQFILVVPIIASLSRGVMEEMWLDYREQLHSLGVSPPRQLVVLLWDGRFALLTAVLAGFGRATAEVGAVMIVGGNIDHVTRVMTTAIALEASKGDLAQALGLGIILLLISLTINLLAYLLRGLSSLRFAM